MNTTRNQNFFYTHMEKYIQNDQPPKTLKLFGERLVNSLIDITRPRAEKFFSSSNHQHNSLTIQQSKNTFRIQNIELPMRMFEDDKDYYTTIAIEMINDDNPDEQYAWIYEWQTCKAIYLSFHFYRSENAICNHSNSISSKSLEDNNPEDSFYAINVVIAKAEDDSYYMNMTFEKLYESRKYMAINDFSEERNENPQSISEHLFTHSEIDNLITKLFDEIEMFSQAVYESKKALSEIWYL